MCVSVKSYVRWNRPKPCACRCVRLLCAQTNSTGTAASQLRIMFMRTHCLLHMIATYWDYNSNPTWLSSKPISSVPCANIKGVHVFAQAPPLGPVHRIADKREQPICKQQHTASSMPPVQRHTALGAKNLLQAGNNNCKPLLAGWDFQVDLSNSFPHNEKIFTCKHE